MSQQQADPERKSIPGKQDEIRECPLNKSKDIQNYAQDHENTIGTLKSGSLGKSPGINNINSVKTCYNMCFLQVEMRDN